MKTLLTLALLVSSLSSFACVGAEEEEKTTPTTECGCGKDKDSK